jgi:polyamine oxidase
MGGFSAGNLLSIDQGGFKRLIQEEANEFLGTDQVMLSSLVRNISYSTSGVNVTLASGKKISGDYLLCTLRYGPLDLKFCNGVLG